MIRQRAHEHSGGCDRVGSLSVPLAMPRNTRKGTVRTTPCAQNKTGSNHGVRSYHAPHTRTAVAPNPRNGLHDHQPRISGGERPTSPSKEMMTIYHSRRLSPPVPTFARREAFAAFLVFIASAVVHPAQAADPTTDYLKPSVSSKV